MLTIKALHCHKCKSTIYSRARHDYRSCECGNISADGGFDYGRYSFVTPGTYSHIEIKANVTKQDLYDDWSLRRDKYGKILNDCKADNEVQDGLPATTVPVG